LHRGQGYACPSLHYTAKRMDFFPMSIPPGLALRTFRNCEKERIVY
jgi:hypothetical protein